MTTTTKLKLPLIEPAQAQKHVTHNEALRVIDALLQLSVVTGPLASPPDQPHDGDCYLIASKGEDVWQGKDNYIAQWLDKTWYFYQASSGWLAITSDDNKPFVFTGNDWRPLAANQTSANRSFLDLDDTPADYAKGDNAVLTVNNANDGITFTTFRSLLDSNAANISRFGINATADKNNRLAVKTNYVLFSHDDSELGNGGIQFKVNKAKPENTASLLFQSNYSGRAELGLNGSDNFSIKTSKDGLSWQTLIEANNYKLTVDGGIYQPSDMRDKTAITDLDHSKAISLLENIDARTFIWRRPSLRSSSPLADANEASASQIKQVGFIAQEVKKAVGDNAMTLGLWSLRDDSDPDSQQLLNMAQFVPILWTALQQTRADLQKLSHEISNHKPQPGIWTKLSRIIRAWFNGWFRTCRNNY